MVDNKKILAQIQLVDAIGVTWAQEAAKLKIRTGNPEGVSTPSLFSHELWLPIQGFEGCYEISNKGRVKSLSRKCGPGFCRERILKPGYQTGGYRFVNLVVAGKSTTVKVHRLVAKHFIDNPNNRPQVNHIDGNTGNNCAENLEWVTGRENIEHAKKMGLFRPRKGAEHKMSKAVIDTHTGERYESVTAASRALNIDLKPLYYLLKSNPSKTTLRYAS